jgi:hypothetical protein
LIPPFDPETGALPPGDHQATLEEIRRHLGFTPRRRWLLKGLRAAGSFCTEKPDPGDVDGYWVEPDLDVYERIDPFWIDFTPVLVQPIHKWKWRMWADHGVEFFIHPAMQAAPGEGFPQFFRHGRDGQARGVIQVVRSRQQ